MVLARLELGLQAREVRLGLRHQHHLLLRSALRQHLGPWLIGLLQVEGMTEEEAADLYAKATGCTGAAPAEASAEPEFKKLGAAVSVGFDIETSNDNVMDKCTPLPDTCLDP